MYILSIIFQLNKLSTFRRPFKLQHYIFKKNVHLYGIGAKGNWFIITTYDKILALMNNIAENQNKRYRKKYKYMKIKIRSLIIENAALCDEVAKIQENILIVKDERKFLLRKLLEYENDMDSSQYYRNETIAINGPKSKPKKRKSIEDPGKTNVI